MVDKKTQNIELSLIKRRWLIKKLLGKHVFNNFEIKFKNRSKK